MPYALCKHGPGCRRYRLGQCSYGHSLDSIEFPRKYNSRMWVDRSSKERGHPGIDFYCGQWLTMEQHERIIMYVALEQPPFPHWVCLYLWFNGMSFELGQHINSKDMGWYTLLRENVMPYLDNSANFSISQCSDSASLIDFWQPPFYWDENVYGEKFDVKMKHTLMSATMCMLQDEYRHKYLHTMTRDGTDLTSLRDVAVCYVGAAIKCLTGFSAAWHGIMPKGVKELKFHHATCRMRVSNALVPEIVAVVESLRMLWKHGEYIQNVVLYCCTEECIQYVYNEVSPTTDRDIAVYPLILLARSATAKHKQHRNVLFKILRREDNLASHMAAVCLLHRTSNTGWVSSSFMDDLDTNFKEDPVLGRCIKQVQTFDCQLRNGIFDHREAFEYPLHEQIV